MRSHHRTLLLLSSFTAACGSAPDTQTPDDIKVVTAPTSTAIGSTSGDTVGSGSMAGSGAPVDPPTPTLDAGQDASPPADPPPATSGSMAASGSSTPTMEAGTPVVMSGVTSGGSMSGSNGGSGGSVVNPPTCSGAASQACGNCNTGTQTRTCDVGVWGSWGDCTGAQAADLSGVGMGDFTISFDLTDTDTSAQAVVNQRKNCTTDSNLPYWDIRLNPTECRQGFLSLEHYYNDVLSVQCAPVLNDGVSTYHVAIHRTSGVIAVTLGVYSTTWADATMWEAIAPLVSGTEVCDGTAGLMPLSGTLTNLCVEKE
jgi:hypothetical protein